MAMKLDDFGQLALSRYNDTLKDYNAKVEQAKSVSSIDEFREKFMENAPELADLNEQIEKLKNALEKIEADRLIKATPLVQPAYEAAVANSGVDITALDEQLKTLRLTRNYLTSIYGDDVLEGTEKVASRSKSGSTGLGGKRINGFEVYVDGKLSVVKVKNKETGVISERSSISAAAKDLKAETPTLQRAFLEAAGSEDWKSESFPALVTFEFEGHNIRVAKLDDSDDSDSDSDE